MPPGREQAENRYAKENHFRFIHERRFRQPEIRGVPRRAGRDQLALILIDVDLAVVYTAGPRRTRTLAHRRVTSSCA